MGPQGYLTTGDRRLTTHADRTECSMNNIDAKALKQLKSLSSFSSSQLQKLADNLSVRHLKKNQIIFDQDEEAKLVYLLISGVVRSSYLNSNQKQTIVSLIPAGEFFGLDSLVPKMHHPFRCDAFETSAIGAIGGTWPQCIPGDKCIFTVSKGSDLIFVSA